MNNNVTINSRSDILSNKKLYKYSDLEKLGFGSRTTIWRKINAGNFPAPLTDVNGARLWTNDMLESYVASLKQY